jgi:hypothetical protein
LIQQANHQQSSAGGRKVPGLSNMPGSAGIQRRAQQQPPQQQQQQDSGRSSYPSEGRSFIAENAKKVIHQSRALASARQQQQQDESKETSGGGQAQERSIAKHENFGKVPAYLQEAKSHLAAQKAAVEEKQKEKELGIPPGMVLMPEDQRLKTLAVLNESQSEEEWCERLCG